MDLSQHRNLHQVKCLRRHCHGSGKCSRLARGFENQSLMNLKLLRSRQHQTCRESSPGISNKVRSDELTRDPTTKPTRVHLHTRRFFCMRKSHSCSVGSGCHGSWLAAPVCRQAGSHLTMTHIFVIPPTPLWGVGGDRLPASAGRQRRNRLAARGSDLHRRFGSAGDTAEPLRDRSVSRPRSGGGPASGAPCADGDDGRSSSFRGFDGIESSQ